MTQSYDDNGYILQFLLNRLISGFHKKFPLAHIPSLRFSINKLDW